MPHDRNSKEMSVVLVVCSAPSSSGSLPARSGVAQVRDPAQETAPGGSNTSSTSIIETIPTADEYGDAAPAYSQAGGTHILGRQQRLEDIAEDMLKRGAYRSVEVGYCQGGHPSLEEAIQSAGARGAQRIVVVPMLLSLLACSACVRLTESVLDILQARIDEVKSHYPDTDIVYAAPPFDQERVVDLLLSKVREYEPATIGAGPCNLNDLASGEAALVSGIAGGAHFRSRMAALGFTPGTLVKMIRNYGHGAVIVSVRGTRVALGRGEAQKVGIGRGTHYA